MEIWLQTAKDINNREKGILKKLAAQSALHEPRF